LGAVPENVRSDVAVDLANLPQQVNDGGDIPCFRWSNVHEMGSFLKWRGFGRDGAGWYTFPIK
jgi:hypothetical protein